MNKFAAQSYIQETVYRISSESPEFYRRYYKKNILVSFFPNTVYISGEIITKIRSTVFTWSC